MKTKMRQKQESKLIKGKRAQNEKKEMKKKSN